jgi:hypothetical protein
MKTPKRNYKKEDTIQLRQKIENMLNLTDADKKFLLDTKTKLINELNKINIQLIKNDSATLILKKLIEVK